MKLREWIDGLLEGFEEDSQQSHAEIYKEIDGYSKELKELERLATIGLEFEYQEFKRKKQSLGKNDRFCKPNYKLVICYLKVKELNCSKENAINKCNQWGICPYAFDLRRRKVSNE